MAVGFVCHVFMCDCGDTAKEVVKTVGQAFYNDPAPPLANLLPDGRDSGKPTLAERRASNKLLIGSGSSRRSHTDFPAMPMPTSPLASSSRSRSRKQRDRPSSGGAKSRRSGSVASLDLLGRSSASGDFDQPRLLGRRSTSTSTGAGSSGSANHSSGESHSETESPRTVARSFAKLVQPSSESVSSAYFVQQTAQNLFRRFSQTGMDQRSGDTKSFSGMTIIDWLVKNGDFADRSMAVDFMETLMQAGSIALVVPVDLGKFEDSAVRYRFVLSTSHSRLIKTTDESGKGSSADDFDSAGDASDSFDLMKAIARDSPEDFAAVMDQLTNENGEGKLTAKHLTSCLHQAVKMKSIKVAEVLLTRGVPVDCRNAKGDTPLHRAAYFGDAKMAKLLLDHGADVDSLSNTDQSTPIFRAAERLRNIGAAILLLEHGAKLQVRNAAGTSPVDLSPDLREMQQRLCEAVAGKFAELSGTTEDMAALRKLASNSENDRALQPLLKREETSAYIVSLCRGSDDFCDQWLAVLQLLFAPGIRRHRAAHTEMLNVLVQYLVVPGKLRQLSLEILADLAESHPKKGQKDCLKQMSTVDLNQLVALISVENPTPQTLVAARVLGLVTIFQRAQFLLSTASAIKKLVMFCKDVDLKIDEDVARAQQTGTSTDSNLESTLLWIVRTLANLSKRLETHQLWRQIGAMPLLQPFLTFPSQLVNIFTARIFVYQGIFEIGVYDILSLDAFTPHVDMLEVAKPPVADGADAPAGGTSPWAAVKGASLEKVASILISESDDLVCHLFFLAYKVYCQPSTLFRLLTYPLHGHASAGNTMTKAHDRVLKLVKLWIEKHLSDFTENPSLLEDLKVLIQSLHAKGGIYAFLAGQLLDMTVSENPENMLTSGITDYSSAAHNRLFEDAKRKVLSGELPITKELAFTLAATQLYVDDLDQQSQGGAKMSQTKLKQVLPPGFTRGKDTTEQVAMEYERICGVSLRDAKHLYLHICQLVAYDYFPVKQVTPEKNKRLPRLLGIGTNRVILLHDKTKEIVREFDLTQIVRWQVQILKDKGKKFLDSVPAGSKGTPFLVMKVEMYGIYVTADIALLQQISGLILRRVKSLQTMFESQGIRIPLPEEQAAMQTGRAPASSPLPPTATAPLGTPSLPAGTDADADPDALHHSFMCHCPPNPALGDVLLDELTLLDLLNFPEEFARQLTVLEHSYFQRITAQDLLDRVRNSKSGKQTECDNVIAMFNLVNQWVVTTVLEQKNRDTRCRVIEQFVQIADECYKLHNFNGVMEIITALTSTSIRRLTETWEFVDAAVMLQFRELDRLMAASDNFKAYRKAVTIAVSDPPVVPYFGILLKDLTFLHHGNPDYLSAGMINVGKWYQIVVLIKTMELQQRHSYNILIVPQAQAVLGHIEAADADWIDERSKMIQPSRTRTGSGSGGFKKSPRPTRALSHSRSASGHSLFSSLGFSTSTGGTKSGFGI